MPVAVILAETVQLLEHPSTRPTYSFHRLVLIQGQLHMSGSGMVPQRPDTRPTNPPGMFGRRRANMARSRGHQEKLGFGRRCT